MGGHPRMTMLKLRRLLVLTRVEKRERSDGVHREKVAKLCEVSAEA